MAQYIQRETYLQQLSGQNPDVATGTGDWV